VEVATKSQSKTDFVKSFLTNNPHGNVNSVNEAWAAARIKGSIGSTLINKMRSEMGLVGNLRAKPKPISAKAKSGTKTSKTASSPGKSMFVKEFLHDNPQGNVAAVNKAWQAAGFGGTISPTVVKTMRASLGLVGNLRRNAEKSTTSPAGKKGVTPRKEIATKVKVHTVPSDVLTDLETDIDRLIFSAMAVGDLTEFEDLLRQARRSLYGVLARG
jgi:hypothetical protein